MKMAKRKKRFFGRPHNNYCRKRETLAHPGKEVSENPYLKK